MPETPKIRTRADYHRREIRDVIDAGPDDVGNFRLQVSGATKSKHLSVTAAQLAAIEQIMGDSSYHTDTDS